MTMSAGVIWMLDVPILLVTTVGVCGLDRVRRKRPAPTSGALSDAEIGYLAAGKGRALQAAVAALATNDAQPRTDTTRCGRGDSAAGESSLDRAIRRAVAEGVAFDDLLAVDEVNDELRRVHRRLITLGMLYQPATRALWRAEQALLAIICAELCLIVVAGIRFGMSVIVLVITHIGLLAAEYLGQWQRTMLVPLVTRRRLRTLRGDPDTSPSRTVALFGPRALMRTDPLLADILGRRDHVAALSVPLL